MNIIDSENHSSESLALFETNRDIITKLKTELLIRFGESLFD